MFVVAGVGDPGTGLNPFDKLRAPSLSRGEAGYISRIFFPRLSTRFLARLGMTDAARGEGTPPAKPTSIHREIGMRDGRMFFRPVLENLRGDPAPDKRFVQHAF